jgi:hypothetical protein
MEVNIITELTEEMEVEGMSASTPELALKLGREQAARYDIFRAQTQAKYRPQGKHRDAAHVDDINMIKGSTSASYLLRRLARQRPDILAATRRAAMPTNASAWWPTRRPSWRSKPLRVSRTTDTP